MHRCGGIIGDIDGRIYININSHPTLCMLEKQPDEEQII
jgi:hypothetical protein